jgi:hypothetical protein
LPTTGPASVEETPVVRLIDPEIGSLALIANAARRAGREERTRPLRGVAEQVAQPALADAPTEHDRELIRAAQASLSIAPT